MYIADSATIDHKRSLDAWVTYGAQGRLWQTAPWLSCLAGILMLTQQPFIMRKALTDAYQKQATVSKASQAKQQESCLTSDWCRVQSKHASRQLS